MNENTSRLHPLTKEQQRFAAEHYYLVSKHLKTLKLDTDDYHDAVILSFLNSVQQYNEHPVLQSELFEILACRHMNEAIAKYQQREIRRNVSIDIFQGALNYGF